MKKQSKSKDVNYKKPSEGRKLFFRKITKREYFFFFSGLVLGTWGIYYVIENWESFSKVFSFKKFCFDTEDKYWIFLGAMFTLVGSFGAFYMPPVMDIKKKKKKIFLISIGILIPIIFLFIVSKFSYYSPHCDDKQIVQPGEKNNPATQHGPILNDTNTKFTHGDTSEKIPHVTSQIKSEKTPLVKTIVGYIIAGYFSETGDNIQSPNIVNNSGTLSLSDLTIGNQLTVIKEAAIYEDADLSKVTFYHSEINNSVRILSDYKNDIERNCIIVMVSTQIRDFYEN